METHTATEKEETNIWFRFQGPNGESWDEMEKQLQETANSYTAQGRVEELKQLQVSLMGRLYGDSAKALSMFAKAFPEATITEISYICDYCDNSFVTKDALTPRQCNNEKCKIIYDYCEECKQKNYCPICKV